MTTTFHHEGALKQAGCPAVSIVFPEDRLMAKMFNADMATFYEKYYEDKGVTLIREDVVTGFDGDGKVEGAHPPCMPCLHCCEFNNVYEET